MKTVTTLCSIISPAILLCCIIFSLPCSFSASTINTTKTKGNETDRLALLTIKSQIHDPFGVLRSSWNDSVPFCQWKGVTCGHKHQRETMLDLNNQNLRGSLSPFIGNLSFLRFLDLTDNSFNGEIPPEVGRLFRLEILGLANNSFQGRIPTNLSHCSNLIEFYAYRNNLVGDIPADFGRLVKLEVLSIHKNHLRGKLPASIGNISALQKISLDGNSFQGRIPDSLGQLKSLTLLALGGSELSGTIPLSVLNISSLNYLNLGRNQLHGNLPSNLGVTLPNLIILELGRNNFTGPVPKSLSNASKLEELVIPANNFNGKLSIAFTALKNVSRLLFGDNNLGSGVAGDLDFLKSLTNCSRLKQLFLGFNQFGGMLPHSIANLSTTLTGLSIVANQIYGVIPSEIINLVNLIDIRLDLNYLTGIIPHTIGILKNLQWLSLSSNNFSGRIPTSLGNLSYLTVLDFGENYFQGSIPPELGKCQNLVKLYLERNKLSGTLPSQILGIRTLSVNLNLQDNLLTGSFPLEVGNLKNLVKLDISRNQFSGEIPVTLGGCTSLEILYAEGNSFNGSIPSSLSSLRSIKELDISHNNLSGQIPKYFENLSFLKYLNLSFNHLEGEVPRGGVFRNATAISLTGNGKLCGGLVELHMPSCNFKESKKSKHTPSLNLILISCGIFVSILLLFCVIFCWFKSKKSKKQPSSALSLRNSIPKVSYQQLLKATDGFSSANLIGEGSFGRVYKGILNQDQDGKIIAVKVMNLQQHSASKSFMAECKALRNIRHRNLVKIISACSSVDFQGNAFKALIYEFMPNGSLERWLHKFSEGVNFLHRLNIAIDVASALDYLHHRCHVPVIHCDLKPSNVLLDDDMVAHVGDFGLARFFSKATNTSSSNQTSSLGLKGTIGYAAPEYGMGSEATTSGDVYSFGILLLEMFTRKRPIDDMFKEGLTLHDFVKMALHEQAIQIADPQLLHEVSTEESGATTSRNPSRTQDQANKMIECLISVLRMGVACSIESPKDRMDIMDASRELLSIKDYYLGTRQDKRDVAFYMRKKTREMLCIEFDSCWY